MKPNADPRSLGGTRLARVFCIVASLAFPGAVAASCDDDPECDDVSAWADFTRITLRQAVSGSAEATEWRMSFDYATSDASIDTSTRHAGKPMAGTIALVGGQVMLTKGLSLEPGYEIDVLDAPVLSARLVTILLQRVFPGGPDEIRGRRKIDRTDPLGIKYATPSASGYIAAPWRVTGEVSRGADGTLPFDLTLAFPIREQDKTSVEISMKGELGVLGRPVFRDSDSLDGWTTYGLGPQETKQEAGTILDYGAAPQEATRYRTIGDVRAFIAAANHPGVLDAGKDFTGFWKQKCDEPYGLQIKRFGDEGKYSIVFCGPGGCGDPSQGRLTFITGDRNYEVVSESEIRSGRSGARDTYYRCTVDTNPVLEYSR